MNRILSALTFLLCSSAIFAADEQGAERVIVYEEGTSIYCGWCIRGLAELEYLAEKYPESVITLSYHDDFTRSELDPMRVESAAPWLKRYSGALPSMHFNRTVQPGGALFMNMSEIAPYDDEIVERLRAERSFVRVGVEAAPVEGDLLAADVRMTAEFVLPLPAESNNYQFSVVTTRNGLGPYHQKNYYSGMGYNLSGWENRANNPKVTFNHVVRDLVGFPGIEGSVPAGLGVGDTADHTLRLTLEEEATYTIAALLVDTRTGEIVNAAKTEFTPSGALPDEPDEPENGIETVEAASAFAITEGGITAADSCRILGIDGRIVASGTGFIPLSPGLYIVEGAGIARKIHVSR